MWGRRGRFEWHGPKFWILNLWNNRSTRYATLLILGLGLVGNELPFEPFDWVQKSLTARINAKPYRGDVVVVEIDTQTMNALGKLRMSDDDLADLIGNISAAKPKRLVIGRIRQHSLGKESGKNLVDAIKRVSPKPVLFVELVPRKPLEFSWSQLSQQGEDEFFLPMNLDKSLAGLVEPATEVSERTAFGAPWGLPPSIRSEGKIYPSIAQLLAEKSQPIYQKYEMDVSYRPSSIPTINAADVLNGTFDRARLSNRQVIIYSVSENMRDSVVTPFGPYPSSVLISIFGAQTLMSGPPLMIGWMPSFILAVISIFAWMNLPARYGRMVIISAFLVILLSPILLERHLIFQQTSNAIFLIGLVMIGRQWSKFRATLALAKSAAETKSWFLAQASHDLRQPIHAIGMLAARLAQTDLTPAQAELASKIDRSIDGANRMLQSLLDLATIESGSLKPKLAPIAVNALLAEIEEQSALAAEREGVVLRFVPSEAVIMTDRSLAVAMLQNIVSNAIKYATGKQVLVGARPSGKHLSLCVYDVGAGISADDMRHVQKAFFRASAHAKGDVKGTGLGLAIVHRLANLLGLTFALRSIPGKGTSAVINGFRLTDAEMPSGAAAQAAVMRPLTGMRVLLADDDIDSLRATEALLMQWGCVVAAYESFPDNLDEVDVIVSDFDFGKTGTLADHRVKIDALTRDGVMIIVMSGHHPDFVRNAIGRQSLLVLAKPVRPAELRSVLMASKSAAAR